MRCASACLVALAIAVPAFAQAQKPVRKAPAPPATAAKQVAPEMTCPAPLGVGVKTKLSFCEVMIGRDPANGVVITIPPHKGPATLTFDLHNLHTYSEEQVKAHRAFSRYTATIGVLTLDNTLLSRAVVQNEFRAASDLVDRVGGGAGPGGVKAVAPTGSESISVAIPEGELSVSLARREARRRTHRWTGRIHTGRPPDSGRQQRDARVSSRTAAETGQAAGEEEVGLRA